MKTIGIIPNTYKDKDFAFTKEIILWLKGLGNKVLTSSLIAKNIGIEDISVNILEIYQKSDFIISLGGDGTILRVAKYAAVYDKPIVGINLGTLGYLTDVESESYKDSIEKILNNNFYIEKRMMIEVNTLSTETEYENLIALNDICITRGFFGNIITLDLFVNDKFIDQYRADGIIISTPTGSTAYNLSAGGPILKPDSKMIAITPICPHMLHSRSFVISENDIVNVKVVNKKATDIVFSVDGQNIIPIKDNETIEIKTSKFQTSIIRTNENGFYDILREKMIYDRRGD